MNSLFHKISVSAKEIEQNTYLLGNNVLYLILNRKIYQNIKIFTENSGIILAQNISNKICPPPILTFFKRFNTVRFKIKTIGNKLEFISNVNIINLIDTFAISLNINNYGLLIDNLNTRYYCNNNMLCIIRSIRFASELRLIEQISFYYIFEQRESLKMLSIEVVINEFNKIILSQNPSIGLSLLYSIGFLANILPEIKCLKEFEKKKGSNHKDNFFHTIEVLENVSRESNSLWLRWAALLHDIGKAITKKYIHGIGWTFYAHEYIGSRLIPYIFHRLKLPMNCKMKYLQKIIQYSSRPIDLVSYEATDSALRRLLSSLGKGIQDLLLLCKADITTKKKEKKLRYINNILLVEKKLKNIDIKDNYKSWLTSISGNKIMKGFKLQPSLQIGLIKKVLKEAIIAGKLVNNFYYIYCFINNKNRKLDFLVKLIGDNYVI